jgi:hypothetical protein
VAPADLVAAGIQGVVLRWMEQMTPFAPSPLDKIVQYHYGWINGYILLDPTHPGFGDAKDGEQPFTDDYEMFKPKPAPRLAFDRSLLPDYSITCGGCEGVPKELCYTGFDGATTTDVGKPVLRNAVDKLTAMLMDAYNCT